MELGGQFDLADGTRFVRDGQVVVVGAYYSGIPRGGIKAKRTTNSHSRSVRRPRGACIPGRIAAGSSDVADSMMALDEVQRS